MTEPPPLWCQREWKAAADFSITCSERLSPSWHVPQWDPVAPNEDEARSSPYAVLVPGGVFYPILCTNTQCREQVMPASMSSFVEETSAEFNVFGMRPEWRTRKHAFR